ncbi:MAG: HD domain-containing protein [Coprobacillus sp.]
MGQTQEYILIIASDDDEIEKFKEIFKDNFRSIVTKNINDAVKYLILEANKIAVTLVDSSIGEEQAVHFLIQCHEKKIVDRIPIFLLHDLTDEELYNQAICLDVFEVIGKPYVSFILKHRILYMINTFRNQNRLKWLVDTQTRDLKDSIQVLEDMKVQVLEALGTLVEFRNLESGEHIYRVRYMTDILMREVQKEYPEYQISDDVILTVGLASILHDVGKIMISDTILNKPTKLTDEEFELMKLHTNYGREILKKLKGLYNDDTYRFFEDVIYYHHEKWDGKGYPKGLKGNEIPIWSQIVSLADVYDALTNERVYKRAFSHVQAKKMIFNGECGMYNPQLLKCFENVENLICDTAIILHEKENLSSEIIPTYGQHNILNDYEKEKAYHRALTELTEEHFFEYDIQYGTVEYYNFNEKTDKEYYRLTDMIGMSEESSKELVTALNKATFKNPTVKMLLKLPKTDHPEIMINCLLTIRTTWDMYTGKCIGGVGKMEEVKD